MRNRFQNFMDGRHGNDQLNQALWIVALVLVVVNLFVRRSILWMIAVVLIVVIYWRTFSRNVSQRDIENDRFMGFISRFRRGGGGFRGGRGYRGNGGYGGNGGGYGSYGGGQDAASRRERAERNKAQRQDKKYYKYFNCPNCNQKVRVPKGRGKIEITCPKCRTSFIRKT